MDYIEKQLRKMARSNYWQSLYNANKNCNGVYLFKNNNNFSGLQIRLLYWLSVYDMLYTELNTHEDDLLSEKVIEDDYRTDAYLIHRNKKNDYMWKKHRQEERNARMEASRTKQFKSPGKQSMINVDLRREE